MCHCAHLEEKSKEQQSPDELITGLIDKLSSALNNILLFQVIANEALQPTHIMEKLRQEFLYCWVEQDKIVNYTSFHFQFKLFFQHDSILYIYRFKTHFKDIQSLHKNAYNDRTHFAVQKFPTPLRTTASRRNNLLRDKLSIMSEYMIIDPTIKYKKRTNRTYSCDGPGNLHWWSSKKRKATMDDINAGAFFLCKLFNSPSYMLQNTQWFKKCNITNGIKDVLKLKANIFLQTLVVMTKHNVYKTVDDYKRLYIDNEWKEMKFHSIFVVCRPMNGLNKTSLTDHWALKLEGIKYLLTIDFYANSCIILKRENNTCLGHRICWFSWSKRSSQLFNTRWGTLVKLYLETDVSGKCIGLLIHKWLQMYPLYDNMNNNCQHFVRDIMSVFQLNAAKYLSTKLDDRIVSGIIFPSLPLMDEIDERYRIDQVKKSLMKIYKNYLSKLKQTNEDDMNKGFRYNSNNNSEKELFRQWLCEELKLDHLLDLFVNNDLNDSRMIKYLDDDTLEQIGIQLKTERDKILMNVQKI
eukprot:4799_1